MKNFSSTLFIFSLLSILSSCGKILGGKKDDQENITTLRIIAQETTSGITSIDTFEFSDPDGPGGNNPSRFDTLRLKPGKKYTVGLQVWDYSKNPVVDLSPEIVKEGEEHQFFYVSNILGFGVTYSDRDSKGNPIGLNTEWNLPNTGNTGNLQIILKHQPRSKAAAPGNINAGETDVDVTFPVIIQ